MKNQDESGRSMIEMLGVLGIMGVIMYGAVAGINFGIDVYRVNATYREIDELSKSIIDLSSWTNDYSHLTLAILCENDASSTCHKESDGRYKMENQWGGDVTVEPVGDNNEKFKITYSAVPNVACKKLRDEANFQRVCIQQSTEITCNKGSNDIIFYTNGSNECNEASP